MELSSLLSDEQPADIHMSGYSAAESQSRTHSYPTRQTMSGINTNSADTGLRNPSAPYADNKSDMRTAQNITMSLQTAYNSQKRRIRTTLS